MNKKEEQQKKKQNRKCIATLQVENQIKWKLGHWTEEKREENAAWQTQDSQDCVWEILLQFFIQNSRTALNSKNIFEENLQIVWQIGSRKISVENKEDPQKSSKSSTKQEINATLKFN